MFQKQDIDYSWSIEAKLVPADSQEFQMFGYSTAVQEGTIRRKVILSIMYLLIIDVSYYH